MHDGGFEIVLSPEQHAGNWLPLDPGAETLWVRQFFYDWEHETPASLWIERTDAGAREAPNGGLDAGFMARRLDALAANVEANVEMWLTRDVPIPIQPSMPLDLLDKLANDKQFIVTNQRSQPWRS